MNLSDLRFTILSYHPHPSHAKARLGCAPVSQDSVPGCCKTQQYENPLPHHLIHLSLAKSYTTKINKTQAAPWSPQNLQALLRLRLRATCFLHRGKGSQGARFWLLPLSSVVLSEHLVFSSVRLLPPGTRYIPGNPEQMWRYSRYWNWFLRNWIWLHHLRTIKMWFLHIH